MEGESALGAQENAAAAGSFAHLPENEKEHGERKKSVVVGVVVVVVVVVFFLSF